MPYQVLAERWHDFYIVAGTAAATLVGLLFVGLSLHLRAVLSRAEVRSLARVTLANFGCILFVSLFMELRQGSSAVSPQLIGAGAFSLAVIAPSLVAAGRSRTRTLRPYQLVLRFGLSGLAYVGVIMVVCVGFATLLAMTARREGSMGDTRLSPIAEALRKAALDGEAAQSGNPGVGPGEQASQPEATQREESPGSDTS